MDRDGPPEETQLFYQLYQHSPGVVWMFSSDWSEALFVNEAYETVWGRSIEDLEEDPTDFMRGVRPDDRDRVLSAMDRLSNEESVELEYRVNPREDYRRHVWVIGVPIYDEDDEFVAVAGFVRDISERKRFEEELERQAAQLEFFNSILRHDVLNAMTVIRSRADWLADELDGEQQAYAETIVDWSDDITDVAQRVRRVIQTLTSPKSAYSHEPVEISDLLVDQIGRLGATHPEVTFEIDVPDRAVVHGDELLSDVFGNLLKNSIEQNEPRGLRITTAVEKTDDAVRVRIADTGSGIVDERKESVFRRGETGHAKETGSGFGLFFVDAMVSEYGGEVWIEDNEAGGATFVIELPKPDADVRREQSENGE